MKTFFISFCLLVLAKISFAQFSILTDVSLLRNWNPHEKFFAIGQTIQLNMYLNKKDAAYASLSYYTQGKFKNNATAQAKNDTISPLNIPYTVHSTIRYRQISLGLKHYFKGMYDTENDWTFYGIAGFGLLLGVADNSFSKAIDTLQYNVQRPISGGGNFKRLTVDAGLGIENPIGTNVYLYSELRGWFASSHYPSPYLNQNSSNLPIAIAVNAGVRILIE